MADLTYTTLPTLFTAIANAIRGIDGTSAAIVADTFPYRITHINDAATADANKILYGYTAYTGSGLVTGSIQAKTSTDVTVSGATVTIPAGFYGDEVTKSVASGSATTPTTTITANPSLSVDSNGLVSCSISASQSITPTVVAGYVTAGSAGTITVSGSNTLQLTTSSISEGTTTVSGTTATRGTATWGTGWIASGEMAAAEFTNTATSGVTYVDISNTTDAPVLITGSYLFINKGYVDNIKISLAKLVPDGASADLSSSVILSGYSAYDNDGNLVAGSIVTKTAENITVSGDTVTIPAGYYAQQYTKSVASGSVTVSGTGSATIDSLTYTYNATSGNFNVTGSGSISGTATGTKSAGYIQSGSVTGSVSGTASVGATVNKIGGSVAISGTATYKPSIARSNATASGAANVGTGNASTTPPSSGFFVAVQSAANTGSISASAIISTAGYGTSDYHNITGASQTIGAAQSDVTYITVPGGSATMPATSVTANPTVTIDPATGIVSAAVSATQSVSPTVVAGYITAGTAGNVSVSGSGTLQLTTKAATVYYPSTSADQTIASGQYLIGTQTIKKVIIDADLIAANIKQGVVIEIGDADDADRLLSVTGNYDSTIIAASY